ncbi:MULTISPECIES: hypothetical protein [unclassified Alcanivorax]|jgi:tetratricopeptide (TPR) repeat protein|uniref:hypothetical protein n=1 Tax=Alcanivorax TaxID=59753 RepID=UPI00062D7FBA|nr:MULTISPECIES: hypothetical protein [unclassified Alcanivorax]
MNVYKASSLTLATVLAGCTTFANLHPENDVSAALEQHDYAKAAQIIEQTDPKHPQYAILQEQYAGVRLASQEYRLHVVQQAEELARKQQWDAAFTLLETNRDKVLDSSAIDELRNTLVPMEARQLNPLLAERRQAQAQALLSNKDLALHLADFHALAAKQERQALAEERELLIADLTTLGNYFADQEQWVQARNLLRYAHQLAPEAEPAPKLAQAQQVLNNEQRRARAKRNRALQAEAEQLMTRYQRNGQLQSLLSARAFLNQQKNNPALASHRKRLEQWCRRRFAEEINTGEALYAHGQYREAYRIWKQIAPLYPDNEELNKKLERSERVLNNLRDLEQP